MGGTLLSGRYEAGETLGHGGVGEVRAGRDRRLGRDVAIKLLRPEMAQVPGIRERFEHEARMAARLVHPHIVAVFDFGVERGVPFLVMERLSGETLTDAIAHGPLSFGETQILGMQVLDAVAAAHESGMIHRDIKPGNILMAGAGCWKVGDFGIAKSIEVDGDPGLTSTGLVVGTPAYLAPERLVGGPATIAGDIYGVGLVLYQALTGQAPLEPGLPLAALASARPRPLHELRPGIPPRLADVVSRALARDPAARFASAAQMAGALRGADGVAATPVVTPTPTQVMAPPARPWWAQFFQVGRRPVIPAVAAVALVLVVSLVVLLSGAHRSSTAGPAGTTAPSTAAPATPSASVAPPASAPAAAGAMPPSLDAALNRLAQAVRP